LDDAAVLATTIEVMNGGHRWDIFISKGNNDNDMKPLWIDVERWVSMMLEIFLMLMCIVSLTLRGVMDVAVHNQYSDIELVSPVYFCNRGIYNEYPVEKTDGIVMMKIDFSFGLDKLPGGILMYEVQRKGNTESDYRSNIDTTFAETVGNTSKMMRFLVIWKIEHSGEPRVHIVLVEHDNELEWDEDKLAKLYDKANDQSSRHYNPSRYTWLVSANTVLEATYEAVQKEGLELKVVISKGIKDWNTRQALWIDPER
jgi:hypothetical protein